MATISQQDRGKLGYGSETLNAVGVVRFTSWLRSGCSWCSLADSALFSRWAEAVEPLGAKFGKERRRVGAIADSLLTLEGSSNTVSFSRCAQTAESAARKSNKECCRVRNIVYSKLSMKGHQAPGGSSRKASSRMGTQAAKFWAEARRICDIMGNKDDLKMRSDN